MRKDFSAIIIDRYIHEDGLAKCPVITLQITDDCCLNCSYCYQQNKGHRMMTKEIAKTCIDRLFQLYDENIEDSIINHHAKGIIIDFIGGEPFMNIDIISYTSKYFLNECINKNHQWLTNFRFNIGTNGILYFEDKVQEYLNEFKDLISLNITIDGPKELHDSCRKDYNGLGSFDKAFAAYNAWKELSGPPSTKVTIAPENLKYVDQIVNFFIKNGSEDINANPIYEHQWTIDEAKLYYIQLKKLADSFLSSQNIHTNIFNALWCRPMLSTDNNNWCGGTGNMLAFDPDGNAYPCLRYMESSLGEDREPIIIGNAKYGIYKTDKEKQIYKDLKAITRRSQSTDECFNCQIASGCAWCSAWNYQQFGTPNKRSTNICWMHRAKSLAHTYFFNNKYIKENSNKRVSVYLPREIATKIISNEEYDSLLALSFLK